MDSLYQRISTTYLQFDCTAKYICCYPVKNLEIRIINNVIYHIKTKYIHTEHTISLGENRFQLIINSVNTLIDLFFLAARKLHKTNLRQDFSLVQKYTQTFSHREKSFR